MRAYEESATIYVTIKINIIIHIYELVIRRRLSSPSFRPAFLRIAFPQPVRMPGRRSEGAGCAAGMRNRK